MNISNNQVIDTSERITPWENQIENEKRLFRQESTVLDCEVEGVIPSDLQGTFHRVGPDPLYPLLANNIPFDGDGHASVFEIRNGHADFRSRYVKTDRYLAQKEARRSLFPMYRNPSMDDPSVKGMSRSTANTHIVNFQDKMLALKEDSAPSLLDPFSLETLDPNYDFGGTLPSKTFTAHPKVDSHTGNMVAFGASAEGEGSDVISVFEIDVKTGKVIWSANIKAPYVSMVHDFAVTENFIGFFLQPYTEDQDQMANGGVRWSWDDSQPSYLGCIRRGGDGSDIHWVKCASRSMLHVMGAFDDKERIYIDTCMAESNQIPFIPNRGGSPWNPELSMGRVTRLTMDMSTARPSKFDTEIMYTVMGELPRQDDRYNTVPYRYGFKSNFELNKSSGVVGFTSYSRFDHQTRKVELYNAEPGMILSECVFAPKHKNAREGEGYLLGLSTNINRNSVSDLLILDAEHIAEGPIAKVKLPGATFTQIHGSWTPDYQFSEFAK